MQGEFSARRLRAFTPRTGTALAKKQEEYEKRLKDIGMEDTQRRPGDKDDEEQTGDNVKQDEEGTDEEDNEDSEEELE